LKTSVASVIHERLKPKRHGFRYKYLTYVLKLETLKEDLSRLNFFSLNRFNIQSIYDSDYLFKDDTKNLREKVFLLLRKFGIPSDEQTDSVILVTNPRYFGFVFNPVSFFFGYSKSGEFRWLVTEINNTFSERHCYLGIPKSIGNNLYEIEQEKVFHVSPFFDLKGKYKFTLKDIREKLDIRIDLEKDGEKVFISRIWGDLSLATLSTLLKNPLLSLMTLPRIYWQAILLFFIRRLKVMPKPNPSSALTIHAEPFSWIEQFSQKIILSKLKRVERGSLTIEFPDGRTEEFSGSEPGFKANLKLNNFKLFKRALLSGAIGVGESYVDGDWDSNDLACFLSFMLDNYSVIDEQKLQFFSPIKFIERIRHSLRANTILGSKKNIHAHYDLGNELFEAFLDPTLSYSSALYKTDSDSLETAQRNKIQSVIEGLELTANDHLLEIGSGWGSLAIECARASGCKVTSITISKNQYEFAKKRVIDAGLQDLVKIELKDYREIEGVYSKVVSIEMIEAVGREFLPTFLKKIDSVLTRNGIVFLQAIIYPDKYYKDYLGKIDWIQKYIFPGSHLPSLAYLQEIMLEETNLQIDSVTNIAQSYAKTLRAWFDRFNHSTLPARYDNRFRRMWSYYLAGCEAEFRTNWLSLLQMRLVRPNRRV
jgi:cyclopropane-fatty-acyl-phospholipid synthase